MPWLQSSAKMQSQYTLVEMSLYGVYFEEFGKDSLRSDKRISGSIGNRPKAGSLKMQQLNKM